MCFTIWPTHKGHTKSSKTLQSWRLPRSCRNCTNSDNPKQHISRDGLEICSPRMQHNKWTLCSPCVIRLYLFIPLLPLQVRLYWVMPFQWGMVSSKPYDDFDGLLQKGRNSRPLAMRLRLFSINQIIYSLSHLYRALFALFPRVSFILLSCHSSISFREGLRCFPRYWAYCSECFPSACLLYDRALCIMLMSQVILLLCLVLHLWLIRDTGLILGLRPANERRRYFVSFIPAWLSIHTPNKMWGEITYLFTVFHHACNRLSLGMGQQFHPTFDKGYNYLSMLGLKFHNIGKSSQFNINTTRPSLTGYNVQWSRVEYFPQCNCAIIYAHIPIHVSISWCNPSQIKHRWVQLWAVGTILEIDRRFYMKRHIETNSWYLNEQKIFLRGCSSTSLQSKSAN